MLPTSAQKMPKRFPPLAARLWPRIAKAGPDECWEWQGYASARGYGQISDAGRNRAAHRVVYELTRGPVPAGSDVCHSCDNRRCCNPAHLWVGTRQENIADAAKKWRMQTIPRDVVAAVRIATGSQAEIAKRFGISRGHVHRIRHGVNSHGKPLTY